MVVITDSVTATTGTGLVRQRLGKGRSEGSQTNRTEFDSGSGHWLLFDKMASVRASRASKQLQSQVYMVSMCSTMDSYLLPVGKIDSSKPFIIRINEFTK